MVSFYPSHRRGGKFMIRIVIVEDLQEVREGLRYLLNMDKEIHVAATFENAEKMLEELDEFPPPDIFLMDIGLPGMSGIEATEILKEHCPKADILILTIFEDENRILNAFTAGATGYILKNTEPGELINQIKTMASGGSPISPGAARKLLQEFRKTHDTVSKQNYNLTPREKEILKGIVDGYNYREIGDIHNIASSTVKKHILHIYRKLDVSSRVEFMKKVLEEKLT